MGVILPFQANTSPVARLFLIEAIISVTPKAARAVLDERAESSCFFLWNLIRIDDSDHRPLSAAHAASRVLFGVARVAPAVVG